MEQQIVSEHSEYATPLMSLLNEVDRVIVQTLGSCYVAAGYPSLIYNVGRTNAYVQYFNMHSMSANTY